ncbi:hypothetical protein HD806DRAFT_547578 [Xylariaceae sp. AK1471]|nr:hypothetical protein HD806DRAFT_547578 [Xylariaceae sp. AK1471]
MATIQILSDLHLESPQARQLANFDAVFLVLGNHEPWHSTWANTRARMRTFEETIRKERESHGGSSAAAPGEFVLLDQTRYDIPRSGPEEVGVMILGCTLFSRVLPEKFANDHSARLEKELAWLNEQVVALEGTGENRKIVIFTHFSPTLDDPATDPKHRNSPIQAGFVTDLRDQPCWKSECVKL